MGQFFGTMSNLTEETVRPMHIQRGLSDLDPLKDLSLHILCLNFQV